jgi:hypothetical protein
MGIASAAIILVARSVGSGASGTHLFALPHSSAGGPTSVLIPCLLLQERHYTFLA